MGVSNLYKDMICGSTTRYGSIEEKLHIVMRLKEWGIYTDILSGSISYIEKSYPFMKCRSLFLLRHAETEAVGMGQFMSDTSNNSRLTKAGIKTVKDSLNLIDSNQLDIVLYGPIKRVIDTKNIVEEILPMMNFVLLDKLKGIDNSGWEYKTYDDLKNDTVFIDREIRHNIFAKTERGTSWGQVLCNCANILEYINLNCKDMNILLVSQGSVLRGIEILLHQRENPWIDYTVSKMFNLSDGHMKSNYGKISKIL